MRLTDVDTVVAIDSASFADPWPRHVFIGDLQDNVDSHLFVVEHSHADQSIVAYGGFWLFEQEAHIATIASHPDHRRLGYGQIALAGMLDRALTLNAETSRLEVRQSNTTAQTLYEKYGFKQVARKRRYYRSNGEDAYIMVAQLSTREFIAQFQNNFAKISQHQPFTIDYGGYLADHINPVSHHLKGINT